MNDLSTANEMSQDLKVQLDSSALHSAAKDMVEAAVTHWTPIYSEARARTGFYNGDQWSAQEKQGFSVAQQQLPPVENVLPVYVKQVEADLRQRQTAINYYALDERQSEDNARNLTGLVRAIEQESNAPEQYIHAAGENGAMVPGMGYMKVKLEPVYPDSDDLKIVIRACKDPFKVFPDPLIQEMDGSDAEYWVEIETYTERAFKRAFPGIPLPARSAFGLSESAMQTWAPDGAARYTVAKLFYFVKSIASVQQIDGNIVTKVEEFDPLKAEQEDMDRKDNATLSMSEEVSCKIRTVTLTADRIISQDDYEGDIMPYASVFGSMMIAGGERKLRSVISNAMDAQRNLNYVMMTMSHRMQASNKAPWMVPIETATTKELQAQYNTTHNNPPAAIFYKAYLADADGTNKAIPVPQRADMSFQIADLVAARESLLDSIKRTIGVFDAGLGATEADQSGIAIKTLAQASSQANYHFSANYAGMVKRLAVIIANLVPKVYSEPRQARLLGKDDQIETKLITGAEYATAASYGVACSLGPNLANQRQAELMMMTEAMRVDPSKVPLMMDELMKALGNTTLADRFKYQLKAANPELFPDTPQGQIQPEAQAIIQKMEQVIAGQTEALQAVTAERDQLKYVVDTDQVKAQASIDKAMIDRDTALAKSEADTNGKLAVDQQKGDLSLQLQTLEAATQRDRDERTAFATTIQQQLDYHLELLKTVADLVKTQGPAAAEIVTQEAPAVAEALTVSTGADNAY